MDEHSGEIQRFLGEKTTHYPGTILLSVTYYPKIGLSFVMQCPDCSEQHATVLPFTALERNCADAFDGACSCAGHDLLE